MSNMSAVSLRTVHLAAATADCDPRTVTKVVDGHPVRPRVRERILTALRELGVDTAPFEAQAIGIRGDIGVGPVTIGGGE